MKISRIFALILCAAMAVSVFVTSVFSQDTTEKTPYEVGDNYICFDFSDITGGIVNSKPNATVEKNVTFEGMNAVKFTPTPDTYDGNILNLDCYNLHKYISKGVQITVPDYKYVGITYYYAPGGEPSYTGNLRLGILPGGSKVVKSSIYAESHEPMVVGKWTEAYFDFSSITLNPDTDKPYIQQCHFNPFGATPLTSITADDVFYVAKYTFYKTNPNPDAKITVNYSKATPDAQGEEYAETLKYGEKFTLPENPFTYDNSEFLGWISSVDGKTYPAGTEFDAEVNCTFTVSWKVQKIVEDFISLKYTEYSNEIVNGADTAYLENVTKDGRDVVRAVPNPTGTSASKTISLDGYKYASAGIDLNSYRWFAVEYFYESPNPHNDLSMRIDIMTNGNVLAPGKSAGANSQEYLVANTWAIALFDMTVLETAVNPDNPSPNMRQMHIRPYGNNTREKLTASDVMYVSRVMFFKEKPDFRTHEAYMNGYTDGTFLPGGTMTRAEACTVVARLLESEENIAGASSFADVAADQWYAKYIGYCQAKGLLDSYRGNFEPGKAITRAEFAELVYLTGLAKDKGSAVSFHDVAESHPKFASIKAAASAGLINGYANDDGTFSFKPDNTITRAEVVTVINRARGLSRTSEALTADISLLFLDVDDTHWAFADIAEATVPHVEWDDAWLYPTKDPIVTLEEKAGREKLYNIEAGKKKIAELDALEAKRIEEIKNTPNMDLSAHTGRRIYVSMNGDDNNDGLSQATAVRTFKKGNTLAKSGDVVLLERGGLWRERINAKANVTYSAYGTGAKPMLYGSTENGADPAKWSLVYENKETGALIWKYSYEGWLDIGTIVFNEGEGYAYKDMPDNLKGSGKLTVYRTKNDYDYTKELDRNFEFFHKADSVYGAEYIDCASAKGPIYLRCDNGNPGKIFDSIEFVTRGAVITCGGNNNVTIDNLCIKYSSFGVSSSTNKNLTVTNCEFYWIGGNIQNYSMRNGAATRYGNAIEVYGGIDGYLVDNCYFYEIYDAAVTHQVGEGSQSLVMDNITYSNNVMDKCQYSIEYFFGGGDTPTTTRQGKNVLFTGNLCRRAGYGFGSTRRDLSSQRHIRGGGSRNEFTDFRIENNIFDRSVYELVQTNCHFEANAPTYNGNTFIQGVGNQLYSHSVGLTAKTDAASGYNIKNALGDKNAQVYYADYIPPYEFIFSFAKTAEVTDEDRIIKEASGISDAENADESLPTESGESTEILEPMIVKTTANKLYAELRKGITIENMTEEKTGINYGHGTIVNENASINLDCYGLPALSLESGTVYIKVLLRTNCTGKGYAIVYNMKDSDGNKVGNGVNAQSGTAVTGSGEWEDIIIKVTNFPAEATSFTQIHLVPLGSGTKGNLYYNADGTFKTEDGKAPYIDIAAWAIFQNLASAQSYDLAAASK